MDADVIAINVRRWMLSHSGVKMKSDAPLQFALEVLRSPTMAREEELQPRPLAMFAQLVGVAKQFGDTLNHRKNLVPAHEGIQGSAQVRRRRQSTANS